MIRILLNGMINLKNKKIKNVIIIKASSFLGKSLIEGLLKIKNFKISATPYNFLSLLTRKYKCSA